MCYSNQGSDEAELTYHHIRITSFLKSKVRTQVEEALDLSNEESLSRYVCHTYPKGSQWTPERLEVNGRKGRRAVCVISRTKTYYSVLDLDSGLNGEDSGTERSEMSVEEGAVDEAMA